MIFKDENGMNGFEKIKFSEKDSYDMTKESSSESESSKKKIANDKLSDNENTHWKILKQKTPTTNLFW